jgi:hypothetical protein
VHERPRPTGRQQNGQHRVDGRASMPRTANRNADGRPLAAVAAVSVLFVGLIVGLAVLHPWSNSGGPLPGVAAASLDPDAPAFPVPAGSTLLNAQVEGSGPAAYRLASWQSSADYAATATFYRNLSDPRWKVSGSPATTPDATDFSFSDGSAVFASAEIEIARTNAVRIEVRFLPRGGVPASSHAPGPTRAIGPLPAATSLPDGFPAAFVPAGSTLVDASSAGTTYFAVFSSSLNPAAYKTQISSAVTLTGTSTESGATVISFTLNGNPGQAVIDPASHQISVEVTR